MVSSTLFCLIHMNSIVFFVSIIRTFFICNFILLRYINMILLIEISFNSYFSHIQSVEEYFDDNLNINFAK